MKLREFRLLTDENIDPEVIAFLRGEGFGVLDVREASLGGSSDTVLLRQAFAERRVVITHDSDFGTLAIRQHEPITGIVFLRPGHIDSQFTIATLRAILDLNPDVSAPFVIVARRSGTQVVIRVRCLSN